MQRLLLTEGDFMHCSGCGKDVPFAGEVCPYCKRNKRADQTATVVGMLAIGLGGWIGGMIGGFVGTIVGGVVLGVIAIVATMGNRTRSAKQPPVVQVKGVEPNASPASRPLPTRDDLVYRLQRLDDLKAKGLISDDEHADQRARILSTI
jgi:hypothetical protein